MAATLAHSAQHLCGACRTLHAHQSLDGIIRTARGFTAPLGNIAMVDYTPRRNLQSYVS